MTLVQFKPFALESTSSFIMAYLYCHFWGSKCFQFARKCDVRFLERPVLKKRSTADLLPAWQQHASLVLKNLYIWGVLPSFSNEATSDSGEPLVLYASVQLPLGRTTGCQRQHLSDVRWRPVHCLRTPPPVLWLGLVFISQGLVERVSCVRSYYSNLQ